MQASIVAGLELCWRWYYRTDGFANVVNLLRRCAHGHDRPGGNVRADVGWWLSFSGMRAACLSVSRGLMPGDVARAYFSAVVAPVSLETTAAQIMTLPLMVNVCLVVIYLASRYVANVLGAPLLTICHVAEHLLAAPVVIEYCRR